MSIKITSEVERELWKTINAQKTNIDGSNSISDVVRHLRPIAVLVSDPSSPLRHNPSNLLCSWQEYMMSKVWPDWGYCLDTTTREELIDSVLTAGGSGCLLEAIERSLSSRNAREDDASAAVSLPFILKQLEGFVDGDRFVELFEESVREADREKWKKTVNTVIAIPNKISNAAGAKRDTIENFSAQNFLGLFVEKLIASSSQTKRWTEEQMWMASHSFERICRQGLSTTISQAVIHLCHRGEVEVEVAASIVTGIRDRICVEKLVEGILRGIVDRSDGPDLARQLFGRHLDVDRDNVFTHILTSKFFLVKVFDENFSKFLVELVFTSHQAGLKLLRRLVGVWSDPIFIRHTDFRQQKCDVEADEISLTSTDVTDTLLFCLQRVDKDDLEASGVVPSFISGTHSRIDSHLKHIAKLGTTVGEAFSVVLNPENPLKFDGFHEEEKEEEKEEKEKVEVKVEEVETKKKKKEKKEIDPDAPLFDDSDEEEEEESDDDLKPFDLEDDDSDLQSVKSPVHMTDCLNMLRQSMNENTNSFEMMQISMKSLASIIQTASQEEIDDTCTAAIRLLFIVEQNFNGFGEDKEGLELKEIQQKTIKLAILRSPKICADFLCQQFYDVNHNLQQRAEMLVAMSDAAREMSSHLNETEGGRGPVDPTKFLGKVNIWSSRLTKPVKPQKIYRNRFREVAQHFFYGLANHFDRNSRDFFYLLGRQDHILLDKLVFTLSVFVECYDHHDSTGLEMCRSLMQLALTIRHSDSTSVRRAVLYSFRAVFLACLPVQIALETFSEELETYRSWLMEVAASDSDQDCRTMSNVFIRQFSESMKENE
ncbi:hypothetical protein PROFUN_10522 [Planoprotostelium fungivorum]|uniref:Uncharacterized protein n=1 Tax=Planoprotostelium fungivorum TaxID=1890364 RepID=A0A2P6NDC3_9EUKA|nr:hypothetical protein PROFUN_10522 [Planoprotostelium fungivorum]